MLQFKFLSLAGRLLHRESDWGSVFGNQMTCKQCGSNNLHKLNGELTASFPNIEEVKVKPFYLCQEFLVCFDCGFADLQIPKEKLESLKKNKELRDS